MSNDDYYKKSSTYSEIEEDFCDNKSEDNKTFYSYGKNSLSENTSVFHSCYDEEIESIAQELFQSHAGEDSKNSLEFNEKLFTFRATLNLNTTWGDESIDILKT